jgi:ribose-phosphate pyrophosphokinase
MIDLFIDNKKIDTGRITFSDGAFGFDLKDLPETANRIVFSVDPSTKVNTILDELYQLNDAIAEELYPFAERTLFIPYLPYGRADRQFSNTGNSGLHTFLLNINGFLFDKIVVVDPHNPNALLKKISFCDAEIEIVTQRQALAVAIQQLHIDIDQYDAIVAPDKGAVSKAQEIADYYGLPLIVCTKQRDPATGKLSNPVVNGDVAGLKLLIVDDIGDYNNTFAQLTKELLRKEAKEVDLYVTHLIAPNKLSNLEHLVSKVYCYHCVCGYMTTEEVRKFNDRNFNRRSLEG